MFNLGIGSSVSRRKRERRRRLILFSAAALLVFGAIVFLVSQGKPNPNDSKPQAVTIPAGSIRLGFNLPCAVDAADSERVYAAVRQRDKASLMNMIGQRRLRMLGQDTYILMSREKRIALVEIVGDDSGGRTCYVPLEMIDVVQRKRVD